MKAPYVPENLGEATEASLDLAYRLRFAEFAARCSSEGDNQWDPSTLEGFARLLGDLAGQAEVIHEALTIEVKERPKKPATGGAR